MPEQLTDRLVSWCPGLEGAAREQAERTSRLPFVAGHVALMPDAHFGLGSTVGSVIPTRGAIIPAAVGVDIGCGMIAVETDATAGRLPDNLDRLMPLIADRIPAGVGAGHGRSSAPAAQWYADHPLPGEPDGSLAKWGTKRARKIVEQYGTLGSGNHFVEVCVDERDVVWVVLHSGSRGIGNELARAHIDKAKKLAEQWFIPLEDPDLAYLVQGTPEFGAYIRDMNWAQDYALANREQMMDEALRSLFQLMPAVEVQRINCHHNFTTVEHHHGKHLWITRKGAIKATTDDLGVIPGSMGTQSYIVRGKSNPASFNSCSHGAGRRMSRGEARRTFTEADLTERMGDRVWNADHAKTLIDEIPDSYKNIDEVMAAQADLVTVEHSLRQIFNYKGT